MNDMTMPKPETTTVASRGQARKRLVLLVVIPLLALVTGGVIYLSGGGTVKTDNAYIKADLVPISAEVSGPRRRHVSNGKSARKSRPVVISPGPGKFCHSRYSGGGTSGSSAH